MDINDAKVSPFPSSGIAESSSASINTPWVEQLNPNGMIHWWQTRNLRSIDGLPSFPSDLGKGFPFNFGSRRTITTGAQNFLKPSPRLGEIKRTRSSTRVFTEVNSISTTEPPQTTQAALQIMTSDTKSDAWDARELAAYIVSYFPLIIALLFGTLFGRWYEQYAHAKHGLILA